MSRAARAKNVHTREAGLLEKETRKAKELADHYACSLKGEFK
jgi:hypothetical protein